MTSMCVSKSDQLDENSTKFNGIKCFIVSVYTLKTTLYLCNFFPKKLSNIKKVLRSF